MQTFFARLTAKFWLVLALFGAGSFFAYSPAMAALKCEEMPASRVCIDSAPKPYPMGNGNTYMVPPPLLPGYPSACWNWNRKFQCIETNPVYACDSGKPYDSVKQSCSLTSAVVKATLTINAIQYITDADYGYTCGFGEWITPNVLPPGKECVSLKETTVDTTTVPSAPGGSTAPSVTPLNELLATVQTKTANFVCYDPPVTVCADTCFTQKLDPLANTMVQTPVACTAPSTSCVEASDQCEIVTLPNGTQGPATGPDGRCVKSKASLVCQNGDIPRCLTKDSCVLEKTAPSSVQANGVAASQEQTYVCSNTQKSCAKTALVSNCLSPNAWGWDKMDHTSINAEGLGAANSAMAKIEGIQKGVNDKDLFIFSGQNIRCHYSVGNFLNSLLIIAFAVAVTVATGGAGAAALGLTTGQSIAMVSAVALAQDAPNSKAMGADCCKDYVIKGSEAWYKFGKCSADEVKLATARMKGLAKQIGGDYCSKKSGFPIKQCVEKSKSYCVFDDMLALVINEQGRMQLDSIAAADPASSVTSAEQAFPLFAPPVNQSTYPGMNNGAWAALSTTNNSRLWYWKYPGYCRNPQAQAAAYTVFNNDLERLSDTRGTQPGQMTKAQALAQVRAMMAMPSFQDCASVAGDLVYLTCSLSNDGCDQSRMPRAPGELGVDDTGAASFQPDPTWRMQNVRTFYGPSDYGVVGVMASNSSYAAVANSISSFITSVGSCKTTGECLFRFAVTDKTANNSLGARKRIKENIKFPLYTLQPMGAWPAVDYVPQDGSFPAAAYAADANRGLGEPVGISTQRFLFHPNLLKPAKVAALMPKAVLLDWAYTAKDAVDPRNDYSPLMVPTSLPPGTSGWFPYGTPVAGKSSQFFLSGGCDANSRWCDYQVQIDLNVKRHPWGSAQEPRCWGFTMEQMSVLDFDKMDLSRWINSLDLSAANVNGESAKALTKQATTSAQAFYGSFKDGSTIAQPASAGMALVANTNTLPLMSAPAFEAYVLKLAVPSNWPYYFDKEPNNNPVTNVQVNWGDGTTGTMTKDAGGRGYVAQKNYGDLAIGTYKIVVTLNTALNGSQTLSTKVSLTPDSGEKAPVRQLDFETSGVNGQSQKSYAPSAMSNGNSQAPAALGQISPGTKGQFEAQGATIGK